MPIVIMAILTLALGGALVSFVVMGIRQSRHSRRLARRAQERGLRFSAADPFEIPERYQRFDLLSRGHAPRAIHVSHGRIGGRNLRAFEFSYEVGHGTRRSTCRYAVILLETAAAPGDVILWNHSDAERSPLRARDASERIGCWSFCGPAESARRWAAAMAPLGAEGVSLEIRGTAILFCLPAEFPRGGDYFLWMDEAICTAEKAGLSDSGVANAVGT